MCYSHTCCDVLPGWNAWLSVVFGAAKQLCHTLLDAHDAYSWGAQIGSDSRGLVRKSPRGFTDRHLGRGQILLNNAPHNRVGSREFGGMGVIR